ncbi:reverse transcriptase%2C partial [Xyrichtys novacula]|uniref:Reverse transcriptase, partial n=1 Tax=Xyrichtys novacula TaxID=13765 RepID=A0AAV1HF65_XYRNO|nr:reverse transcriptase%2C partial [Xyrichtys novacula]
MRSVSSLGNMSRHDGVNGRPAKYTANLGSTITSRSGDSQGCVLSPQLYTHQTHNCTPTFSTNHIKKCADDTTMLHHVEADCNCRSLFDPRQFGFFQAGVLLRQHG